MPSQMKVDKGSRPQNIDKSVRFRTTYYFRVFGKCAGDDGAMRDMPEFGGLYRFRMTGKASSLTTHVKFESGTLPAESIDPFGVSLRYDEKSDSLAFSDGQLERRMKAANELLEMLKQIEAIRNALPADIETESPGTKAALGAALATFTTRLGILIDLPSQQSENIELARLRKMHSELLSMVKSAEVVVGSKKMGELVDTLTQDLKTASKKFSEMLVKYSEGRACAGNDRGFLILGPEGWKQFNPNERLVMAMYSSGRPIISTMNELSARALRKEGEPAEVALAYAEEDAKIQQGLAGLRQYTEQDPKSGIDALKAALSRLSDGKTK